MRVQSQDLPHHLKSGLRPFYFVFGEETFLHSEALETIRAYTHQQGYIERERFDISTHFNWEDFKATLNSISLFSSKKLIECRLIENKISKTTSENLVQIISHIPIDTILLLFTDKLESNTLKTNWFTTLEKQGTTIWARPLARDNFITWLKNKIHQYQLLLTEEAFYTLIERTEGNLNAAAQSLEKLQFYSPNDNKTQLSADVIRQITSADTRFSVFDLIDALLQGSIARTKLIFWGLKNEGIESILILWAITREVRAIIPVASSIESGCPLSKALSLHAVWKHKVALLTAFFNRTPLPLSFLHQLLIQAKTLDDCLKGRKAGNPWCGLFALCLTFAGIGGLNV